MKNDDQAAQQKMNLLASLLRLGHEAFTRADLKSLSFYIVNQTRQIIPYNRACLVDFRAGKARIVSVMGQGLVEEESEYCLEVKALVPALKNLSQASLITADLLEKFQANEGARQAFAYFQKIEDQSLLLIPLFHPQDKTQGKIFFWLLELPKAEEKFTASLVLLSNHYAEALWFHAGRKKSPFSLISLVFRPFFLLIVLAISFTLACVYWKIPLRSTANFELVSDQPSIAYAPLSGVVQQVFFENGVFVSPGKTVLVYDKAELLFELLSAENRYHEATASLEDMRLQAFSDGTKRAEAQILEIKQKQEKLQIEETKRRLRLCDVISEQSGILSLEEKHKIEGKKFEAGEKLFEVTNPQKLRADVYLDESEGAILMDEMTITLYLHARPEEAILAQIQSISPKPTLTQQQQVCYRIQTTFASPPQALCGMRGIARIEGRKVSLGYALFRNAILWWRKF